MKQKRGFTIVELLIVIVVIAVLAAISVVAYNGIQTRSKNTVQISAAGQYIKLIRLYKVQNGIWPSETGCLGTNNVDTNADGIADCGDNGGIQVNAALNNQLKTVGSLPDVVTDQILGTSGTKSAGIRYWGILSDGRTLLTWYVKGSTNDCKPPSTNSDQFVPGADGQRVYCQYYLNDA